MSLTAMLLLLRQPQKGLSVSMVNTLGEHLLERVGGAVGPHAAARLAELERENVALQLGLAALVKLLEERGQITRADAEKIVEIVQRVATAQVKAPGPAVAPQPSAPAAPVESEAAAIAEVATALAQVAETPEAVEPEAATVEPVVEAAQDLAALAQALERTGARRQ